jgi:serine/threonine-protein kinase
VEESPAHLLRTGEVLAGKYRIEGVLGAGGMATVYSAWHEELEQRVALKMLHAAHGADHTTVKRFIREARNVGRIKSEHVAHIMDVGRHTSGQAFMVMEYLEGSDLAVALRQHGPLPIEDVADHLVQACHALAVAHGMGIVHRDLKPANLFLTKRIDGTSCVKVLDFGIATAFYEPPQLNELTSTTNVIGSPKYMSPEQLANAKDVDPRADIWSLGVIAFRLLTGQLPYIGGNLVEFAMNITAAPPSMRKQRADVPAELESIIHRCMERDRDLRWPDVGALAGALSKFVSPPVQPLVRSIQRITEATRGRSFPELVPIEVDTSSSRIPLLDGPSETTQAALVPSAATMRPPEPRRSRGPLVALAVLGGLLLFGSAVVYVQLRRTTVDSSATSGETTTTIAKKKDPPSTSAKTAATEEPSTKVEPESSSASGSAVASATTSAPTIAATIAPTMLAIGKLPKIAPSATTTTSAKPQGSTSPKDVWGWGE